METLGEAHLKFAGEDFSAILKKEGQSLEQMKTSMEGYLTTINNVYAVRIQGEKTLADEMEKAGADSKELVKQQIEAANIEISLAQARLSAWQQYYDALTAKHIKATEQMKQKSEELLNIETAIRNARMTTEDLVLSVKQKSMNASEKYYSTIQNLEDKYRMAMQLSSDEKISILQSLQQSWAGLTEEVKENENIVISAADAQNKALWNIQDIGQEIINTQEDKRYALEQEIYTWQKIQQAAEITMAGAREQIELYKSKIMELDLALSKLKLEIDNKQALGAIEEIKRGIDSIPDVTVKKVIIEHVGKGSSELPIMDKIAEIADAYDTLPAGGKFQVDFSALTSAISLYADLSTKLYAFLGQAEWLSYLGAGLYPINTAIQGLMDAQKMLKSLIAISIGEPVKSYQRGTDYVPKTGLYKLHQGEKVIPANKTSQNITLATTIHINEIKGRSGGAIAKEIDQELANLWKYNRSQVKRAMV